MKKIIIPELVENHKELFTPFTVSALLNAQCVLDHVQKMASIGIYEGYEAKKSEDLWSHPAIEYISRKPRYASTRPETLQYITKSLFSYFPFLEIMCENQRMFENKRNPSVCRSEVNHNDAWNVLNKLFRVIKAYRDYSTHYKIISDLFIKEIDSKNKTSEDNDFFKYSEIPLTGQIGNYYTVALRNAKEKFNYDTKDLGFIQDNIKKTTKGKDGKRTTTDNLDFFLALKAYNGDYKLHLSGMGVALVLCLFLDKQQINLFVESLLKLPFFKNQKIDEKQRRIIIQSMSINSIRLPKDRIHSEKGTMTVALDMINELKRCPAELFDTLPHEKQERFRTSSIDHTEVLLKRSSDRFAPLLLQYIDYGKKFKDIRFHVNMGKLRYLLNAEKTCIDGETRVRVIEHPLNGFGRIDEIEQLRCSEENTFADSGIQIRGFENMKRDDADPANYPYIVDTYSHYMLENNKVELSFCGSSSLPKIEEKDGKWYVKKVVPACRMSVLELPAMAFHMILFGADKTEKRIKEVYNRYCRLFEAMQNGTLTKDNIKDFGIAEADIPQKVLDSLDPKKKARDLNRYVKETVEDMIDETEYLLGKLKEDRKAVNSSANKMGKRGFRQIRPGKLAEFLARDIVMFQPTKGDGTDKMTGLNYRIMQSSIATYDSESSSEGKTKFYELFKNAGLISNDPDRSHPFLKKVFDKGYPDNVITFYKRYLEERSSYLWSLNRKLNLSQKVSLPFINAKSNKWRKVGQQELGEIYGNKLSIELPRQMFDDDIKQKLSHEDCMKDIDFEQANITYLIAEYLKRVLDDDFQPFYGWERNYRYIDMLKLRTDKKGSLIECFTSVEDRMDIWSNREDHTSKYKKWAVGRLMSNRKSRMTKDEAEEKAERSLANARADYQKDEKVIRRYKVQDALLFWLAKDILTEKANFDGTKFRLKEIMPDADRGILSEKMPMSFTFEKDKRRYTIESDSMKLKNYGDFYPLANDRRLPGLVILTGSATLSKENLACELDRYNQCRPKKARLVFEVEKFAFDKCESLVSKFEENPRSIGFRQILEELERQALIEPKIKPVLKSSRNAFEHNIYPDKDNLDDKTIEVLTIPEVARMIKSIFEKYSLMSCSGKNSVYR